MDIQYIYIYIYIYYIYTHTFIKNGCMQFIKYDSKEFCIVTKKYISVLLAFLFNRES